MEWKDEDTNHESLIKDENNFLSFPFIYVSSDVTVV